jgi:UTP--glucose-1-phosphate uridylyltransferase
MGAAIESFPGAAAIVVPRERFAPVKTCNDLVVLRSDCFELTGESHMVPTVKPTPVVDLDADHYKFVEQIDALFGSSAPSLKDCKSLKVSGKIRVDCRSKFVGHVALSHAGDDVGAACGEFCDQNVIL